MHTNRHTGILPFVVLLSLCALLGTPGNGEAQVSLSATFVPRKETGEKTAPDLARLNDVTRIKAEADSSSGILRVTFEVDEQFRSEVKKPPYTYDWDTLDENDGQHTISITAYNTKGQTGVTRLKVTVLNQLNLGVKHFVQEGMAGFEQGDYRLLDRSARKAFKISRVDVDSIRLMALDAGIRGDVNRGFQLLDDQQSGVPKYEPFTLRVRGYLLLGRGAEQASIPAMLPDVEAGLNLVREQVTADYKAIDTVHPEGQNDYGGQIARGDALFKYGGFDAAVTAYERAGRLAADNDATRRAQQRCVMALLRAGRLTEAERLAIKLAGNGDNRGTGQALHGAVLFQERRYNEARSAVRSAVADRNPAALVVATLADLARNDRTAAYGEARDAVNAADTAETQYVAMAALGDAGEPDPARRTFRIAFLRAPLFAPTVVERAYQILAYDRSDDRWIQAMNLFDLVLKAEPENANALAGRVVIMLHLQRYTSASPVVARMAANDPTSPDIGILKAAAAAKGADTSKEIQQALDMAHRIDPNNFNGGNLPRMDDLVLTMIRLRRTVPLSPALLDISDMPPAPAEKEEGLKSARAN
jgi:tetratricopeptide (TPR) repeat protein